MVYAAAAAVAPAANSQAAKPAGSAAPAKGIVEKEVDKVMTNYPQHAGMAEMLTDLFESVVSAGTGFYITLFLKPHVYTTGIIPVVL